MDLIYTNNQRVDIGVLSAYDFDLSFGGSENDFEMTLGENEPILQFGSCVYIEGTEYGGIVDGVETGSDSNTITYSGRTWHGILNSKIIEPDAGEDYYTVSGDAHVILSALIDRLGLSGLFTVDETASTVTVKTYKFNRYCPAYDGIRKMLKSAGAKLQIRWEKRSVVLSVVPVVDYTTAPIDGDVADLTVKLHNNKVNHLICLGTGELSERQVIHLYVNQFGKIGTVQYYTGLDEVTDVYENTSVQTTEELLEGGIERLEELMDIDKAEISIPQTIDLTYDIGDLVGASETRSGISVKAAVTQKIVQIKNGTISTDYKTGG